MLVIRGLSVRYPNGKLALDGASLSVRAGQLLVVLGSNGSGKSTLLRAIARTLEPTAGEISLGDDDMAKLSGEALRRKRSELAMIFQHAHLVGRRSVRANVAMGALARHGDFRTALGRIPEDEVEPARRCLAEVGLLELEGQRSDTLSGGQAQRVAIARALLQRPRVLLADEPIASLDPEAAEEILRLLRRLASDGGLAVLCVLHQPALALRYADRIVALRDGRVAFDLPVNEVAEDAVQRLYQTARAA